jgi:DnaJ-class molecular chaperone
LKEGFGGSDEAMDLFSMFFGGGRGRGGGGGGRSQKRRGKDVMMAYPGFIAHSVLSNKH